MPTLNKVFLMGNLTKDPELRYTPSGKAVCEFTLAINKTWGDKKAIFPTITAWEKRAETLTQYLSKGSPLFVEGHLAEDSWTDKQGQKRSKLKVVVDGFQFIGSKGQEAPAGAPEAGSGEIPF